MEIACGFGSIGTDLSTSHAQSVTTYRSAPLLRNPTQHPNRSQGYSVAPISTSVNVNRQPSAHHVPQYQSKCVF